MNEKGMSQRKILNQKQTLSRKNQGRIQIIIEKSHPKNKITTPSKIMTTSKVKIYA